MDKDLAERAARYLGVELQDVIVCRREGEIVTVVVNPGPEYYIPIVELEAMDAEVVGQVPEVGEAQEARPEATDAAVALAREAGIDLQTVAGTGKDGKITIGDVRSAVDDAKCDGDGPEG